jgi:hypothetical protein
LPNQLATMKAVELEVVPPARIEPATPGLGNLRVWF